MKDQKIIVLRFSAMGDVAMVASVLKEFTVQNPTVQVIMVSRPQFEAFFTEINGVTFHAIHPRTVHKGLVGLFKLYQELKHFQAIGVADLHDNIRSRILSGFFRLAGVKIRRIDKGRKDKKALTRIEHKIFKQLKQTVERYADVFRAFGFNLQLSHKLLKDQKKLPKTAENLFKNTAFKKIGISPFAQHKYKMYSLEKMEQVITELEKMQLEIFIFGGGQTEQGIAQHWESDYTNIHNLIGQFTLEEELAIISNIDLMLSMDSSGMHLASLVGIPVISIWGPTHPYAGFLGYGQQQNDCLQINHPNRPTSIYGNKPCLCGVDPCIDLVDSTDIVNKIKEKLYA
ncbi:ADP-heptose:LPS heptosyltransferase [Pedobacter sp. UYEF25]